MRSNEIVARLINLQIGEEDIVYFDKKFFRVRRMDIEDHEELQRKLKDQDHE